MRDFFKQNAPGLAGVQLGGLLGLFLLLFPQTTANIVFFIFGTALIVAGVVHAILYFADDARNAIGGWQLATGIMLVLAGIAVFVLADALIAFLPFIFGLILLIGGVFKLQGAFDMRRMGVSTWARELIYVAVSVVMGLVIICNPFSTMMTLMRVIGAALVIEAVQDAICALKFYKIEKKF